MRKLVVCILGVFPLLSAANDNFPLEFSLSSGYLSSNGDELVTQQQEINFNLNLNFDDKQSDSFSFDFSPLAHSLQDNSLQDNSRQYGDLLFSHYQQVFTSAMLASQLKANENNDVQLHYLHLGSNYQLSAEQDFWLSAGLGVTYFSAPNRSFNDDIKFSMSLGVHKDFAIDNNFNLRIESRVYSIFLDSNNASVCQQLACSTTDSLWLQNEISLSVNFRF